MDYKYIYNCWICRQKKLLNFILKNFTNKLALLLTSSRFVTETKNSKQSLMLFLGITKQKKTVAALTCFYWCQSAMPEFKDAMDKFHKGVCVLLVDFSWLTKQPLETHQQTRYTNTQMINQFYSLVSLQNIYIFTLTVSELNNTKCLLITTPWIFPFILRSPQKI